MLVPPTATVLFLALSGAHPNRRSSHHGPPTRTSGRAAAMALSSSAALADLLRDDFAFQLEDNPEYASQSGFHARDGSLQDLSPSAFEARSAHAARVVAEAEKISPGDLADDRARLHLRLLLDSARTELRAFELGCHLYPINSIGVGGVAHNFVETLEWQEDFANPGAVDKFLSRLEAFPRQAEQYVALLREGLKRDRVASRAMLRMVGDQILDHAREPTAIQAMIEEAVRAAGSDEEEAVRRRADYGLASFQEACRSLERFVREEYGPHAREGTGCGGMPTDGAEIYALCLRFHTTTDMTADEVHELGLSEVARIRGRYRDDVLAPLGRLPVRSNEATVDDEEARFDREFSRLVEECRTSKEHYFESEEALLQAYRDLCAKIGDVLPQYFNTFPESPLEIVSKSAATAPAAYYLAGTPDGSRPGRFYVNVSNLSQRPKYEMVSLALHEAIPGHHHQVSIALENPEIPDMLRFLEDRRYEFCPARRQLYASYLEGWALYCESLGEEMGMYESPLQVFGKLSMEMMRAVRLVVDTGIHAKGWSVERAIEYMMAQTGMHRHECEAECFRYEAWPGQACAYKVGEIAIWRMRRKAETELGRVGRALDLRAFHDVLLNSGPMPLDELAATVDRWVRAEVEKATAAKKT